MDSDNNSLENQFRYIVQYDEDPPPELRKKFIKLAVQAGLEQGQEGYLIVLESLRIALDNPFPEKRRKFLDHIPQIDETVKWNS